MNCTQTSLQRSSIVEEARHGVAAMHKLRVQTRLTEKVRLPAARPCT